MSGLVRLGRGRLVGRGSLALALVVALVVVAAGCDSGSSPTTGSAVGPNCDHWCGNGSASVTFLGQTTTISGGGCYDTGSAGVDVRFGDWQGVNGTSSYLQLTAFREGGATPTPAPPTANPLAAPSATDHPSVVASGSVQGATFTLEANTTVTLHADGTGSFSGTDVDGQGLVTGTFTCG
jgi:hypothetical protein